MIAVLALAAPIEGLPENRIGFREPPVFRVDVDAHGEIPEVAGETDRIEFVLRGGFRIAEVRRPKQRGATIDERLE